MWRRTMFLDKRVENFLEALSPLTLEVSGRCHERHEDTAPIRSGPLDRIVMRQVREQ
jgi:hypothetical protein